MTGAAAEPEDIETDGGAEAFALALRVVEALLFASAAPLTAEALGRAIPAGIAIEQVLARLAENYSLRGVNLRQVAGGWAFRTAPDLGYLLAAEAEQPRRLSRAALEVLSIIAYHQPVTRAEIEEIRGVADLASGTLDVLMEAGWVRLSWPSPHAWPPRSPIGTTPRFPRSFRP